MDSCAIVPLPRTVDPASLFPRAGRRAPLVSVIGSLRGAVADDGVVVATVPALAADVRESLRGEDANAVAVVVAGKGGLRQHVLAAGLQHLGLDRSSSMPVLVGDHRHPLSTSVVAGRVIAALRGGHDGGHDVVVPTLPVTDTVKTVGETGAVLGTVDRSALRTVQYPRGYAAAVLWELLSGKAFSADSQDVDEFAAALREGLGIGTVDGDPNALSIELPRDARLLDAIIACRPE